MSDEEKFLEEDQDSGVQEVSAPKKIGFLPAIVLKILKYVGLGLILVIFIVTVTFITVSIIDRGRGGEQTYVQTSPHVQTEVPIYAWWGQDIIGTIRTRTRDAEPYTVMAGVRLGYIDENLPNELNQRIVQIKDLIRGYFERKTAAQLAPEYEDLIKEELRQLLNDLLTTGDIQSVAFEEFSVVPF